MATTKSWLRRRPRSSPMSRATKARSSPEQRSSSPRRKSSRTAACRRRASIMARTGSRRQCEGGSDTEAALASMQLTPEFPSQRIATGGALCAPAAWCNATALFELKLSRKSKAMLDHVSLGVTDIERSRRFYDAILRPLGLVRIVDFGDSRGSDYGAALGSLGVEFTITREAEVRTPIPGAHVCFRAPDRAAVDAFHAAALACGGCDDGAPGLRPNYHADYYGAFVLDPDGYRIEAVCHAPTSPTIVATG